MGLNYNYGIVDFFKESWQGNFNEKSFLMLGKQSIMDGLTKYDIFSVAKKLGAEFNYKLLKASTPAGRRQLLLF